MKLPTIMLGVILMGSVNGLWGDILERTTYADIKGDYTINIVSRITGNCDLPYWITANGCTFWNADGTAKRIEVRQKTINPNKKAHNEEEHVMYEEIGHATICGRDEKCADEYADKMMKRIKIAK